MTLILPNADYDDWTWLGAGVNPPGAIAPAVLTEVATDEWQWVFTNNTIKAFPNQQIPHGYEEGTDIISHIHWAPTTSATYTGTWTMVFTGWNSVASGTAKSSPQTSTVAFNSAMTAGQVQSADFSAAISGTGRKISSCATITLKLALSSGAGCALLGFDGHFKRNSLGSRQILAK